MVKPEFEPARLVKSLDRWYILFYAFDPRRNNRRRVKWTFNLNRIHDLRRRERRAVQLVDLLNDWMESGYSAFDFSEREARMIKQRREMVEQMSVSDAVERALQLKKDLRKDTYRSYKGIARLFLRYAEQRRWLSADIGSFRKTWAAAYMDHCLIDREVSVTTYNNNLRQLRALWETLVERGYVEANVWKEIKFKKSTTKQRRNFSKEEARIVIAEIQHKDPVLFLALLLQYTCFLRPTELLKLRREDVDLEKGVVMVSNEQAKTGTARVATIPEDFLPYFILPKCQNRYFIFGRLLKPHPVLMAGKGSLYRRHKSILQKLHQEGKLKDITGLTWYSWKDTGVTDALEELPILPVQEQAGHSSPQMTLRYRHKPEVNEHIRQKFKNNVIKKPRHDDGASG